MERATPKDVTHRYEIRFEWHKRTADISALLLAPLDDIDIFELDLVAEPRTQAAGASWTPRHRFWFRSLWTSKVLVKLRNLPEPLFLADCGVVWGLIRGGLGLGLAQALTAEEQRRLNCEDYACPDRLAALCVEAASLPKGELRDLVFWDGNGLL